jgi:hypothetical protein
MRTIRRLAMIAVAGCAIGLASAQEDQAPSAQAASEQPDASASAPPPRAAAPGADNLSQAERAARIDLTMAQARLEVVLARKALRMQQHQDAAMRAQRVLDLLKEVPPEVDGSVYELQAEGILARAAKAGVDLAAVRESATSAKIRSGLNDYLDDQTRAAARVARRYTGADRDVIDTRVSAEALRQRTLRRQVPDDYGYKPAREIIDVDAVLERDRQRLYYEDALRNMYQADEARLLTQADEARVVPDGDVAYPDDWPEKVARRGEYAGGQIARSPSWIDQDGREWYVAIYDIRDLIYVPPDFQPPFSLDLVESARNELDRHALRWHSGVFRGYYPAEIAAGIPLLRYFGGVDDFALRGPKYSVERQRQIVEMIRAFTAQLTERKIISLEP